MILKYIYPLTLLIHHALTLKQLKLGVAIPWSGKAWDAGRRFASGMTIAVERINSDPYLLPDYNVTFTWADSKCTEKGGLDVIIDMYTNENIHAIIGPACSDGCKVGSLLAAHWNLPIISYGCAVSFLSDVSSYPNFARTVGVYSRSGRIFIHLMKKYGWKRIAIITPTEDTWSSIISGVRGDIEKTEGLEVSYFQNFDKSSITDENIRRNFKDAIKKSNVFLLGGYKDVIPRQMLQAKKLGLMNGEYVFIVYEMLLDECKPSVIQPEKVDECEALKGLLDISLFVPQDQKYENFSKLVRQKMADAPFFRPMKDDEDVEDYAAFLHDATMLYAHALNKTINNNGSITDGHSIINYMLNYSFEGASGRVEINGVGDRESSLQLRNIMDGPKFKRVGNFYTYSDELEIFNDTKIMWPGQTTNAPLGRPKCGFSNEFCPAPKPTEPWVYAITAALIAILALVAAVFFVVHYRRKAFEKALVSQQWRVKFSDIEVGKKVTKFLYGGSKHNNAQGSNLSIESYSYAMETAKVQIFTSIGLLQGNCVAIKQLRKHSITLTRNVLLELKEVSELQHQNINTFVGACVDNPNICIITQYCNKGSLQDVLYNEDLKLDWMFQISIASDIARGMQYLHHNSSIGAHGNLKSTNCVIDSRWVCKITDFGLQRFKEGQQEDLEVAEDQSFNSMLWTAPEHIGGTKFSLSQPGDVYSYGIILQEIVTRTYPYSMFDDMTAKDVVYRVMKELSPPFRPIVACDVGHPDFHTMMKQCWSEYPHDRPKFEDVMKTLKKLNGGKNINIVDNMINMMEKYTDHLEELVADRTKQLEDEKAKTDELLYRMLPRTVAEQLKLGEPVRAETFEMVTIFFSDIVGFTKLASESTPLEVVDLLNDLYTCFDQIVDQHHVYKVETIGDAYMVVSGLPEKNDNKHAGEIARMSLDLLSATNAFRIRHKPDAKLQLRVGIHSGPVVAGVVGLKMPRYCLFGDTVNYASRMESSGLALRVHVSPECCSVLNDLGGYHLVERGPVAMKGKGTIVTYFLAGYDGFSKELPDLSLAATLEEHSFK